MTSQIISTEKKRWYAVYTKPRWEKKVNLLLQEKALECYCPLNKVRRKWSDRIKTVEEPLFKSYVFVRIAESEMTQVRMTNGVVNFVYWNGKPANIREREIDIIRKFLNDYIEVQAQPISVEVDNRVMIQRGAFMDKQAVVTKLMHKRVQVVIESIGFQITAFVDRANLKVIGTKKIKQSSNSQS